MARAWRTCHDACRDRSPAVAGKAFPAVPAHAQPSILRIWHEAHGWVISCQYLTIVGQFRGGDVCSMIWTPYIISDTNFHNISIDATRLITNPIWELQGNIYLIFSFPSIFTTALILLNLKWKVPWWYILKTQTMTNIRKCISSFWSSFFSLQSVSWCPG